MHGACELGRRRRREFSTDCCSDDVIANWLQTEPQINIVPLKACYSPAYCYMISAKLSSLS